MSFNDMNPQACQSSIYWSDRSLNSNTMYDSLDIYPAFELNKENIAMLNNTVSNQQHGLQSYESSNDDMRYESDSNHNQVYTQYLTGNGSVSEESSPSLIAKNISNNSQKYIPSPEAPQITTVFSENEKKSNKNRSRSKRQFLDEQDAMLIAKDDSELTEEELQLKRRAQNRAAQRAFRERKETKLKDLEAKLLQSEKERRKLLEQLDLIKQQNITISTENEILKNKTNNQVGHEFSTDLRKSNISKFNFPQNQTDFIEGLVGGAVHELNEATINKVYDSPEHPGKKILAVGAVWDYLQLKIEERDLDYGSIDIVEIMNKLKGHEKCHGYGPAYSLDLVDSVIEESIM